MSEDALPIRCASDALDGGREARRGGGVAAFAPLPEELGPLLERLKSRRRIAIPGVRAWRGTLGSQPLIVAQVGSGGRRAGAGVRSVLDQIPVQVAVLFGVAGGLTPELATGTIIAAEEVRSLEGADLPRPDRGVLDAALSCSGILPALIMTAPGPLLTIEAKEAAAPQGFRLPVVVDQESESFVRVAVERRIPWLVLRAISDGSTESLPAFLGRCLDRDGAVSRTKVVRAVLAAPWRVAEILRLRVRVRECAKNLAGAMEESLPKLAGALDK